MCCRSKRLWQWRHQEHPVQAAEEGVDQDPQWSRLQMGGDSHRLQSPGSPTSVSTTTCHHHCIQNHCYFKMTLLWMLSSHGPSPPIFLTVKTASAVLSWSCSATSQRSSTPRSATTRTVSSCSLTSLWQSKYSNIADLEQFFLHSTFWTRSKFFHI